MESYILSSNDYKNNYFHFTKESNLKSIEQKGLLPKKGHNARYIEKTSKVFFVEGLDNFLILFDCWIHCVKKLPRIPLVYTLGARAIRYKWFPKFIADGYFKFVNSKPHNKKAYKTFDKLLNQCVVLNLDLEEGIDFKKDDEDEIKKRKYRKEYLITMGYKEVYSNINSTTIDNWNMHTISKHKISSSKIKLCYLENSYRLKDIFEFIIQNTELDIENMCEDLNNYLISRKMK